MTKRAEFYGFGSMDAERAEELKRVAQYFMPTRIPAGGAPDAIREKWVGVLLPVRGYNIDRKGRKTTVGSNVTNTSDVKLQPSSELVRIELPDAIDALMVTTGCNEAARWWAHHYANLDPVFGTSIAFQRNEGDLYPAEEIDAMFPVDESAN
jgi:hypothetical protein